MKKEDGSYVLGAEYSNGCHLSAGRTVSRAAEEEGPQPVRRTES